MNEQYLASIRKVLTGDVKSGNFNKDSILQAVQREIDESQFYPSREDSVLRDKVQQEDKYNPLTENPQLNYVLFPPAKDPFLKTMIRKPNILLWMW